MNIEALKSASMIVGGACALAAGITACCYFGSYCVTYHPFALQPAIGAIALGGSSLVFGIVKTYDIWEQYQTTYITPYDGHNDL